VRKPPDGGGPVRKPPDGRPVGVGSSIPAAARQARIFANSSWLKPPGPDPAGFGAEAAVVAAAVVVPPPPQAVRDRTATNAAGTAIAAFRLRRCVALMAASRGVRQRAVTDDAVTVPSVPVLP
jgi:hypothetical protein